MIALVIVLCVFFSVFCIVTSLMHGIQGTFSKAGSLVDAEDSALLSSPLGPLIGVAGSLFSGDLWQSSVERIEEQLIRAGNPGGKISGSQFLGAVLLAAVAMFLFNMLTLSLIGGFSLSAVLFPLMVGGFTFVLGRMWLSSKVADRRLSIGREFPYFLDMSVMVMGAGSTFPQSIKTYTRENPGHALSDELNVVSAEVDYGKTMLEALTGLDERIDSAGVKNALKAILQGERMGTPISANLVEQADALRFMRSQDAERIAEEMKIKMQGPAMLLLVSVLILILGPAAVNLKDSGMF